MILGFGKTETDTARKLILECVSEAETLPIEDAVKKVNNQTREVSDKYDEMDRSEAPERYTYFYANTFNIHDGFNITTFTMMHINRRHAMSPDGWALLKTKWVLITSKDESPVIYREA